MFDAIFDETSTQLEVFIWTLLNQFFIVFWMDIIAQVIVSTGFEDFIWFCFISGHHMTLLNIINFKMLCLLKFFSSLLGKCRFSLKFSHLCLFETLFSWIFLWFPYRWSSFFHFLCLKYIFQIVVADSHNCIHKYFQCLLYMLIPWDDGPLWTSCNFFLTLTTLYFEVTIFRMLIITHVLF